MYGQFFNIDESAFSIAPNPKYLYLSRQHEEALAHLVYGITSKGGFVLLTGEIGTGKTTICRCMFEQLPDNTDIAFVINPKFSPLELLASICDELQISYSTFQPNIKDYVKKLSGYLLDAHAHGRSTVLVIDEAQNLSIDALEHIRSLTNIETNEQKLLQIILIGQPELKAMLASPELEQVNQRITARFHIGPLNLRETNQYINHRLSVAGATQTIFSAANIKHIYRLTCGVPRLINILCDRILLGAYTLRRRKISTAIIKQSAGEILDDGVSSNGGLFPKAITASVMALLVSGAVVFAYQNTKFEPLKNVRQYKQLTLSNNAEKNNQSYLKEEDKGKKITEKVSGSALINVQKSSNEIGTETQTKKDVVKSEKDTAKNIIQDEFIGPKPSIVKANIVKEGVTIKLSKHDAAFQDLFRLWEVSYTDFSKTPCEQALEHQLYCYHGKGSIADVAKLNRPVILKSHSDHFEPSYIVMVSVEDEEVIVSENSDYRLVSFSEIESNWSGEFEMLWRPLHPNVSHIVPGQRGEAIATLEMQLASIEGRQPVSPHPFVYSSNLVNKIKTFQIAQNITADGIVGPITQIHINSAQGANVPLLIKQD